jgi:hypothetical protein
MNKRVTTVLCGAGVGAALLLAAPGASADPASNNGHNGQGNVASGGAGQGFGTAVSNFAHASGPGGVAFSTNPCCGVLHAANNGNNGALSH